MTVLKGATAAALYGSRAKDGVIMITTKSKGKGQGIGVEVNTNYTSDTPLDFTDYQYEYGQGEYGVRPTSANPTSGVWSFGEKFQPGMTQVLFGGVTVPYAPVYDRIRGFYRKGSTWTNTVSLSSGGEKGGFNLSFANSDNQGITPNNTYNRKTINLGFSQNLSKELMVSGNINYSNEDNRNPPQLAQQDFSTPTVVMTMANSMPLDVLEANAFDANGDEFVWSRFRNRTNPYFTIKRKFEKIVRDRIFGNITLRYNIAPWLYVQGRMGQDYWSRDQDYNFPTGQASLALAPAGFVNGRFVQETRRFRETNIDFLLGANKTFGKIGVDVKFGGNQMYRRFDYNSVLATDFIVRDYYNVMNSRIKDPIYGISERGVNSLYGAAEVSYNDVLFLNVTARNDWFSTLAPANRSILYPSATGSFVFSQAAQMPSWLSFGKLRAAYAEVGSDTDVSPYSNSLYYGINGNLFPNPAGAAQPVGFINGLTVPNANLKPMRTSEFEIGTELKLFQNKVGIDFAYYRRVTKDQIVSAQVSDASGYTGTLINSGESSNTGFEYMLSLTPLKSTNFQWDVSFNGSYNKTEILKLQGTTPGEQIVTGSGVFIGELRQIVGQPMAQLYGFGFKRDSQGRQIFGANGIPLRSDSPIPFGTALPTWIGGISNGFNYKGIMLNVLIDYKLGHRMLSGTNLNSYRHGLSKETLVGRDTGGVVGEGVNERGETNTVKAIVQDYYSVVRSLAIAEPIAYDAGFWKLRQITLGYDLTKHLAKTKFIKGAKLSFVANNVLMLKKWVPNLDPEQFGFSSDNLIGLESTGLPPSRNIGFNLNLKF